MSSNVTFHLNVSSCGFSNVSDWVTSHDDGGFNGNESWPCPFWNDSYWTTDADVKNNASIYSFIPSAFFQVVIYSLYSVIFVLALVGNLVVCAVVFTSIRKWTVTNFFIVNMAAGDILMAFFCIPFTFVPTFVLLYWPFGAAMCRIVSFSQVVSVFVSAYTMVAISSDRYLAIIYPLRPRMTRKQAKWIIVAVWLAAVLTALPMLLVSELTIPPNSEWHNSTDRYICMEEWAYKDQRPQYTAVLLILQYCFPLAVLIFTYGRIAVEIWGKKAPGEAHQPRDLRLARSKRKMIKMMIIVVFFFAFCWLPFNILQVIGDQYPDIWSWNRINYVAFACHWLAMSHSAYNPIIYCCFNSKFRQGSQVLAARCGCRCLMPEIEGQWTGECDCGCRHSGTQASVHGDHSCAPLQRVNTYTTYTGANTGQRNKNSSCRILLPNQQCQNNSNRQSPAHQHYQVNRNGHSSRCQHGPLDHAGQYRRRSSYSFNGSVNTPHRCSLLSSGATAGCAAANHHNRGSNRPQKYVFRSNFSSTPLAGAQQPERLSGGLGSPTSLHSAVNTTAESHI